MRSDAGTAAAEAAEGVRIHRKLNAEADRAAAAMSDAETTKRRALSEGDTRTAERAEQDLRRARQDYARVPRARGASKLANGVPLDSLAPGEKRALGLGPEGFPLDGEALAETGLDKPLVSLGPDGKPVLSPAAAEEVARVSPELARRMEATERDVAEQPAAAEGDPEAAGGTGGGMPDGPGGAVAGKGAAPPAGPPLSKPKAAPAEPTKGQRVSFLRDGVEVQGKVTASIGDGGFVVETADNVEVMRGADLTLLPDAPKAAKATKKPQGAGKSASGASRSNIRHPSGNPRTMLPRSAGSWSGEPGNSDWHSDDPAVNAITGGKPIRFVNGRPDFSPWVVDTVVFKPMELDGSKADFSKVYEELAKRWKLSSQTAARKELEKRRLTPHHEDSITIQLVPFDLHDKIKHIGSASDMRNGHRHP